MGYWRPCSSLLQLSLTLLPFSPFVGPLKDNRQHCISFQDRPLLTVLTPLRSFLSPSPPSLWGNNPKRGGVRDEGYLTWVGFQSPIPSYLLQRTLRLICPLTVPYRLSFVSYRTSRSKCYWSFYPWMKSSLWSTNKDPTGIGPVGQRGEFNNLL